MNLAFPRLLRSAALPVLMALALLAGSYNNVEAENCTFQCYTGLGRTIGFWQNPNGKNVLSGHDTAWRDRLNQFCLVDAGGNPYSVPAGNFNAAHKSFKQWILGPTGGNMAYMLSKQLAAALLNVEFGFMDHLDNHYVDWNGNKTDIQDLFDDANTLLCLYPNTTGNATGKAEQEALKDLFDALNNNTIPVCVRICLPPVLTTTIIATKFYDLNLNGVWDNNEVVIPGWPIELRAADGVTVLQSGVTDANGEISWVVDRDDTDYVVVEIMQEPYINITALSQNVTASTETVVVDFGNVAIQCHLGLGRTRGFWGAAPVSVPLIEACWPHFAIELNSYCLVDGSGNPIVLSETDMNAAVSALRSFLNSASASNMADMLSAQMATTWLNVNCGFMSHAPGVFVDWDGERRNINEVFAIADALLCANPTNQPQNIKDEMEELKDFFDKINNNITTDTHVYLVLPGPVPFGPLSCVGGQPSE